MKKLAVIAFGGNALLRGDQEGTFEQQIQNVTDTCENLVELIKKGFDLVIGHGNGPQVGNVMLQHEAGAKVFGIPPQPMHFCVSETQGSIAYLIEQQMKNVLRRHGIDRNVVSVVTQVIVDKNDPAFMNPTKPVGPFYQKEEADKLQMEQGWVFQKDPRDRGWRRVVASPKPVEINNWKIVEKLAREGNIVITVGGGGIPVIIEDNGDFVGIDAVIDKDLASATIAARIKADEFLILTDVPKVYINFNKPDQKALDTVSINEAQSLMNEGHFAAGSMAPKVKACMMFVENGGEEAVITEATQLKIANCGTRIIK
ncbi:MAG: carbamate kinase [Sphingobacteriia bacterium]|nr:carbamate kinase [Sphingobacteriia bacterium]